EEGGKALDFLLGGMAGRGAVADEAHHVEADLRQELVEQLLAVDEVIVEGALRDAGFLGDASDGSFGIAVSADHPGGGLKDLLLGPGVALDPVEFCHFHGCGLCHAEGSSSARSTRLSTFPEGLRGRLSRMMSSFGTLKPASRARQ